MLALPILWEFSGTTFYPVPGPFGSSSRPFGGVKTLFGLILKRSRYVRDVEALRSAKL
jgi:hypothetical protein